ncbi:PLP-dependent transferase, partial [Rhizoclosmatium globosum]
SNPSGIVNLGRSENRLMELEVLEMLPLRVTREHLPYGKFCPYRGTHQLRSKIATLLNHRHSLAAKLNQEQVAIANGSISLLSCAAQIIGDPGDAILSPAPTYGSFSRNFEASAGLRFVTVNPAGQSVSESDELGEFPSTEQFDNAFKKDYRIKALLLTNPGNPTGRIIPRDLVLEYLKWANTNNLHVIVDEVYAFSIWNKTARHKFMSALEVDENVIKPDLVHIIWSFSKDFCMNGQRAAVMISRSPQFMRAYHELVYFHSISRSLDSALTQFLESLPRIDNFIALNHSRLEASVTHARAYLDARQIPYLEPEAGIFLWINLNRYLAHPSLSQAVSKKATPSLALFHILIDNGLYIAPSDAFFCAMDHIEQRGMFRLVWSVPLHILDIGMQRLMRVLD